MAHYNIVLLTYLLTYLTDFPQVTVDFVPINSNVLAVTRTEIAILAILDGCKC